MTRRLLKVGERAVTVSNLEKVLWPQAGLTKADLLEYYARLYPVLGPHWQGRVLTVTRYPHGVEGEFFFQKNVPPGAPSWVQSWPIHGVNYVVAQDLATIVWLANSGAIEFHPSIFAIAKPEVPSYAIVDLDPTPPLGYPAAVQAALLVRDLLEELGVKGYPKLSGLSGIHIYIPLDGMWGFELSLGLVRQIGQALQARYPHWFTLERLIKNRRGVYVDYLQNSPGRTMVGVYSPRPTSLATVSTPVGWSDLQLYQPEDFTIKTVPQWVDERGDLFRGVLEPQILPNLRFSPTSS